MGYLRCLLALAVLVSHTAGDTVWPMTGGVVSVQAFYVISGFLITYILVEKYDRTSLFFASRFFRIFPVYWTFLAISLLMDLVSPRHSGGLLALIRHWSDLSGTTILYILLTNLTSFGMDASVFTKFDASGGLAFSPHMEAFRGIHVFDFLLLPQAWSLSLELMFYLIAPFSVRRIWLVAALALASIALRCWIYWGLGLMIDPWVYRFFPTELALFLLGALSAHLFLAMRGIAIPRWAAVTATALVLGQVAVYHLMPVTWAVFRIVPDAQGVLLVSMMLGLPLLFRFSLETRLDGFVGDLSYPIYLSHLIAIYLVNDIFSPEGNPYARVAVALALTLAFSSLCVVFVDGPVDRWRHRRFASRGRAEPAAPSDYHAIGEHPEPARRIA